MKRSGLPLCSLLLAALTGPALAGEMIEGQVLRLESAFSRETFPAPDTLVIAQWQLRTQQGDGRIKVTCAHTALARTDENGRYVIPGWDNPHPGDPQTQVSLTLRPYKAGLKEYSDAQISASDSFTKQHVRYLITHADARSVRFQYLLRRAKLESCPQAGISQRNVAPFFEALYQEGETQVQTEQEREQLQTLKDMAKSAAMAVDRP